MSRTSDGRLAIRVELRGARNTEVDTAVRLECRDAAGVLLPGAPEQLVAVPRAGSHVFEGQCLSQVAATIGLAVGTP